MVRKSGFFVVWAARAVMENRLKMGLLMQDWVFRLGLSIQTNDVLTSSAFWSMAQDQGILIDKKNCHSSNIYHAIHNQ
jgi:hypothetical protein